MSAGRVGRAMPEGARGRPRGKAAAPNHSGTRLRRIRVDEGWTQARLAVLVRQAGRELGQPNECTARMVRAWEEGELAACLPLYWDAVGKAVGVAYDDLCAPWPQVGTEVVADVVSPFTEPLAVVVRRWREDAQLSQSGFARMIQEYGRAMGEPNRCTKRLVQKWESGEHRAVRPNYAVALNKLTGLPITVLRRSVPPKMREKYVESPDGVLDMIDTYIAQLTMLRMKVIMSKDV